MKTTATMLIMLVLLITGHTASTQSSKAEVNYIIAGGQESNPYTPPKGSPERKAILDALREETKQLHQQDVIFVVNYLKVQNGWAWVQTSPQSPDGSNRYEDVSALLRKRKNVWTVVEVACTEEGNPNCIGAANYFKRLSNKFPLAPRGIFPGQ